MTDQPPITDDDLNRLFLAVEEKMFVPLVHHYNKLDDDMKRLQLQLQALLERERMRLH